MLAIKLAVIVALVFTVALVSAAPQGHHPVAGGLGFEEEVDEEVRQVVRNAHSALEEKFGERVVSIEPLGYRKQIVAGKNYFVKLLVHFEDGRKMHAHAKIYNPLFRGPLQVLEVRKNVHPDTRIWNEA